MDTYAYPYRRSPFGLLRQSMISSSFSKSTGNLQHLQTPLFLDINNGSGFSPLRSPSKLVTVDGLRCYLKDAYLQQLSKTSSLWSSLLRSHSPSSRRRVTGDYRSISLYPASKFLVVQTDEGRIVNDFSKELSSVNTSYKRRFRLTGEFGSGKSSLLQDLVLRWCSDDSDIHDRFPVLLYIRSEYAYGGHTLEDVLRSLLPPPELKFVMRILNDRATACQVLLVVDECEKYTQPTVVVPSKYSYDFESGDPKTFPYPLDMNRLLKGLYLPEAMVVFAGRSTAEQESLKRNFANYVVYGLDDSYDHEFRTRNPLFHTLSLILGHSTSPDRHDVLFRGVEKAVTEILARMTRPPRMTYEECIRILGWLSLIWCQDYLPPLTFDSSYVIDRRKELFQRDERLRDDADELLRAAIESSLLMTPGTSRLLTTQATSGFSPPTKKRYDYVLAFPHQSFALYLAARTFVSLNLSVDWSRVQQRVQNGNGETNGVDASLDPNERNFFYFLTGIDRGYAQDLLLRGIRRERGSDRAWVLPWIVSETAREAARPIVAYADEHFAVIGSNECSDSILLNKLTVYYRSAQERSLELGCLLLRYEYEYEGTPVTSLRFRHCNIYDQFLRLSSRRLFDILTTVELHDCQFYEEGAIGAFLMRLMANSSTLTTLRVVKCQKLAESSEFMRLVGSQLLKLHTFQLSDVRDTERSQKAAYILAEALEKTDSIKRLILSKNELADILFTVIVYRLELEDLDLSQCRLANEASAWRKFVDGLQHNFDSPLRKSLISIRLDENPVLAATIGLKNALESCDRLKLISLRNSFGIPMEGERFKDAMRMKQNANGMRRDIFV